MRKYYFISEIDGDGSYPKINLNRYDCDVFLREENGRIVDGYVWCRIGYHEIDFKYWQRRLDKGELAEYEISEEVYKEHRKYFLEG